MVKNYLVSAVRPIQDQWMDKQGQDLHEKYREMYEMSVASFRHYVQEPFEAILWDSPADNNERCNRMNWRDISDLWHSEPCNIFWAGADTMMVKPTSIFLDRLKEYRLFNYTDPKTHKAFKHYFNDDIQYYPSTMSEDLWEFGENYWDQCEGHQEQHWGFDQIRHNAMFWKQDIADDDRCHPKMAYQAFSANFVIDGDPNNVKSLRNIEFLNKWNRININDAHIIHFHASRGSDQVISLMKNLCQQMEITT